MIVLTTSGLTQTFTCIPRGAVNTMIITDDQTNTPVTVPITLINGGDYVVYISAIFNLKEGHFYDLELLLNGITMYKDRIFCTDQNTVTFSVNNGEYTSNTTSNTFIVYE